MSLILASSCHKPRSNGQISGKTTLQSCKNLSWSFMISVVWKFPSLPSTLELLSWLISRSHTGAENIWRKTYMEFALLATLKKSNLFWTFHKTCRTFPTEQRTKTMNSHSHLTQKKTHTHTHTWLLSWKTKRPPGTVAASSSSESDGGSSDIATLPVPWRTCQLAFFFTILSLSLYIQRNPLSTNAGQEGLNIKKQIGFFSSCSVYLWSPLTQWIRVGIMILKPLYCKSKIQSLIFGVHIPFIEANERWFDLNKNTYFARWISSNLEASHVKCQPSVLIKRTCTHMLFVSSCSTIYFPQHPFM